jgi:hypothetical protein
MSIKNLSFAVCMGLSLAFAACGNKSSKTANADRTEDTKAKSMLQGIWVNDDDGGVAFLAKGDSIFYPDSTSQSVYFEIIKDTLFICGQNTDKYIIVKQAQHLFEFKNQNGELVKLVRSEDENDKYLFEQKSSVALNQNQLIKRDTVVSIGGGRYHCYVQVNPTTYKVVKPSYNGEGVEVDNVYHDNIIHLSVFNGNRKVYSKDFYKEDFKKYVPADYLRQSILSDIILYKVGASKIVFQAQICIPDSPTSYQVNISLSEKGKITLSLND